MRIMSAEMPPLGLYFVRKCRKPHYYTFSALGKLIHERERAEVDEGDVSQRDKDMLRRRLKDGTVT